MKKTILLSLFLMLSLAVFAQCGDPQGSSASNYGAYAVGYTQPTASVKVDFKVFPNPTTDYFVLDVLSLEKGNATRIQVYNLTGQAVRSFTVAKDAHYNIADLEDGMYLIQFVDAKDKTIATRKLYKSDHQTRF